MTAAVRAADRAAAVVVDGPAGADHANADAAVNAETREPICVELTATTRSLTMPTMPAPVAVAAVTTAKPTMVIATATTTAAPLSPFSPAPSAADASADCIATIRAPSLEVALERRSARCDSAPTAPSTDAAAATTEHPCCAAPASQETGDQSCVRAALGPAALGSGTWVRCCGTVASGPYGAAADAGVAQDASRALTASQMRC